MSYLSEFNFNVSESQPTSVHLTPV